MQKFVTATAMIYELPQCLCCCAINNPIWLLKVAQKYNLLKPSECYARGT